MKNFLKMMLALSVFALAISGCNIFGSDSSSSDDDEKNDLSGTWISKGDSITNILIIGSSSTVSNEVKNYGNENESTPYIVETSVSSTYDNSTITLSNPTVRAKDTFGAEWESLEKEFTTLELTYTLSGNKLTLIDEAGDKSVYSKQASSYSSGDLIFDNGWGFIFGNATRGLVFASDSATLTQTDPDNTPYSAEYTVDITYDNSATPRTYTYTVTNEKTQETSTSPWSDNGDPGEGPVTNDYYLSADKNILTTLDDEGLVTYDKQ